MAANLNRGLALVQKAILEASAVSAIIAPGAVYVAYPRDTDAGKVALPAVVVSLEGGEGEGMSIQLIQALVMIWTVSRNSQAEAGDLHHAVMEAIQSENIRSTVTLAAGGLANPTSVRVDFQGGIRDTWNEGLGAWMRGSRWQLTIAG